MLKPAVVFHLALFAWDGYLSALVDSGFGHGAIVFSQGFVLVVIVPFPMQDRSEGQARPDAGFPGRPFLA